MGIYTQLTSRFGFGFIALIFFLSPLLGEENLRSQILFIMNQGQVSTAIDLYRQYRDSRGQDDDELLEEMCLILFEQGFKSCDTDTQMITLFGAGIAMNEKAFPIMEMALTGADPKLQLVSLNFLSRWQNDRADEILKRACSSPFLLIQLEAAYYLAKKKHPAALGYIEALMSRIEQLKPLFPQVLAALGTPRAIRILRQMLNDTDEKVRIEAILHIAETGRDDLIPQLRRMVAQTSLAQQEAAARALGLFKDEGAIDRLERLLSSNSPHVVLAAAFSLYQIGKVEYADVIRKAAKMEFPFAILMLGEIKGSEELLASLLCSNRPDTRLNASLALLKLQDARCLPLVKKCLIEDSKSMLFTKLYSPGRSLLAYHLVPKTSVNLEENPLVEELSKSFQEAMLRACIDLPETQFLEIANDLFSEQCNSLIPTLVQLLENVRSQKAIDLLKRHQQKVGAPLIRNYCNLALVRLHVQGPYEENLRTFVTEQSHIDIMRFRPFVPLEMRPDESSYQLTPEETSLLLVESLETLTKAQGEKDIATLLDTIQNGSPKNRYALAGLLMRAIQ